MGVENPLPKLAPLQRKRSMSHPGPRGLKKQQELPAKQQSLTIAQLQEKIDELEIKQKSLAKAKASRRDRMEVALQIHQYKVALQEIPIRVLPRFRTPTSWHQCRVLPSTRTPIPSKRTSSKRTSG